MKRRFNLCNQQGALVTLLAKCCVDAGLCYHHAGTSAGPKAGGDCGATAAPRPPSTWALWSEGAVQGDLWSSPLVSLVPYLNSGAGWQQDYADINTPMITSTPPWCAWCKIVRSRLMGQRQVTARTVLPATV